MHSGRTEDHWLQLHGRPAYYQSFAPGPAAESGAPLLLLHGISCSAATWRPFVDELCRRADHPAILVPDLPAHGHTAAPSKVLDMDGYADWVTGLLDVLNVDYTDVMGHSMGCQVALALADRHPDRVRRIVLLGPTTGGRHVSALRDFVGLLGDSLLEPIRYNWTLLRVFARLGAVRYLRTVIEMQRDDAFVRAARGRHPLLVLRGERDRIVPKAAAEELARVAVNGTYREIPGAAHAAQYSRPRETGKLALPFLR